MKTKLETDQEIFIAAIQYAKKSGYVVPPLEYAVLVKGSDGMGWSNSMRVWALGLIFSHPFLKAVFGEHNLPRERDNDTIYAIGMWAQQIAFEHEGRIYAADRDRSGHMAFPVGIREQELCYFENEHYARNAPANIVEARTVVKQLQDMAASIPVRTHKLDKIRVDDITPEIKAWKKALQQMAEYDNPFLYLQKYLLHQKNKKTVGLY